VNLISTAVLVSALPLVAQEGSWGSYGGDAGGTRYSTLKQINSSNVGKLKIAWTYHTGVLESAGKLKESATFEATPILVDGALYLTTPFDQVIALNPATGAETWKYDPVVDRTHGYSEVTSRGVSAWRDSKGGWRLFVGTIDARLIALDAKTGKPCADFGDNGQVDLTRDVELRNRGDYQVTSAPAIVKDLVIVGSSIGDNRAVDVERGIVRAFDASTGKLRWTWDPIPWASHNTPRTGAGNAWSTLSADLERDLVFVPTGSASPDFYAGQRPGDNKWADSVVALRASTGEFVWGFQVVHHDIWDYDVAAQPSLFTFKGGTPAVAVTTKIGHLFLLDRLSGKPLLPVEERPVPKSDVPGEEASPTQPFPLTDAMAPQTLTPDDAWGNNPEDRAFCREKIASYRSEGLFTPPSLKGTIAFPGNIGGVNWGSAAIDPARGLLIANTNRLPFVVKLIPRDELVSAVAEGRKNRVRGEFARQTGTPYGMYREPLFSHSGLPCNAPPWGTVTAMNLATGKKVWESPLGSMAADQNLGSINLGGPIATAGGLVFDGSAMDTYLRAFDIESGKEVWRAELPASAQATPMTYSIHGKQFVVICAGGHGKLGTKQGDAVVAFALPE
jgi:quinoprotein glucose dehydrogenase